MISYAEAIAQCAEHIALDDSHGYSQPNRRGNGATEHLRFADGTGYMVHGGDMDCSEMVKECVAAAGLLSHDDWVHTRNEDEFLRNAGFALVPLGSMRRGDVLWKTGHTGVYLGDGMMADAHGDEVGGIDGPTEGDQTGHEIEIRPVGLVTWQRCYRPPDGTVPGSERMEPSISRGIDVSNWQGEQGADAIRNTACGFAIVKASEGDWFVDEYARANADAAIESGKLLGFYHYANGGDPVAEAEWFVARCKDTGRLGAATLWLDYEEDFDSVDDHGRWAEVFMRHVDEMTGKTCGFYSYKSLLNMYDFTKCAHRPLWGAQYATNNPTYGWQDDPWQSSHGWGAWGDGVDIFQYSGNGYVDGFQRPLDLNQGRFSAEQWAAWATGTEIDPEPAPKPNPIEVDGYWGCMTTAALQRHFGTPVDGVVDHQWPSNAQPAFTSGWNYDKTGKGSPMVRAMQSALGVNVDGLIGPHTIKAMQRHFGTPVDGELWGPSECVKAMQRRLNAGTF